MGEGWGREIREEKKSVKNKNQYSQSGAGDATFPRNLKRATAFERKRKGEG